MGVGGFGGSAITHSKVRMELYINSVIYFFLFFNGVGGFGGSAITAYNNKCNTKNGGGWALMGVQ
jgi:hypothetical protein